VIKKRNKNNAKTYTLVELKCQTAQVVIKIKIIKKYTYNINKLYKMDSNDICQKLYNEGLITYDKYLDCSGNSKSVRKNSIGDKHKYGIYTNEYDRSNIYDKQINIYSLNDDIALYLAVIKNSSDIKHLLGVTSGIINENDNIFIIEKINESSVSIKHFHSDNYISYDIPNLEVSLSKIQNNKTEFSMKTYFVNELLKYKFILLKNGIETNYNLIIKNGNIAIERDSNFYWSINNLEQINVSELDLLLEEINENKEKYNMSLYNYNLLYNKKKFLNELINGINTNVNNIFNNLRNLQKSMIIDISLSQIDISQQDTINYLNENQFLTIKNKIESINSELENVKADLQMYKNELNNKINDIKDKSIINISNLNTIKTKIQNYNNILLNNNIIIDINKFKNSKDDNNKKILKSEINKEVSNKFNNKKTRINIFYIIIISILLLIIIIQLSTKLIFTNN
jgi:tetrahydromethanopterin S-methyltransferase subunit G